MDEKKICSIILGAPDGDIDKSLVSGLIICADHGLDHALLAGITPDIVVGDFDSAHCEVPSGAGCVSVSPIKDDTDAILAADTALQHGCNELKFFCALGGRLDHTFANIQMLEYIREKGAKAVLYGKHETAYLCTEAVEIPRFDGFVSVFALSESAVVSEIGMKYSLDRHQITRTFPLGISNEITAEKAKIVVHEGIVLITEYRGK